MKTYNYNIDLMLPQQINKEILFNESIATIDNFCNSIVIDFRDQPPKDIKVGQKYIINSEEKKGMICYCSHISKGWQYLKPQNGMINLFKKRIVSLCSKMITGIL